ATPGRALTPPPGFVPPPLHLSCQLTHSCPAPSKRALLVLMENEGYKSGLPEDFGITIYRCGSLRLDLGPDESLLDAILRIAGEIATTAIQCSNPANWEAEVVPLTQYVAAIDSFTQTVTDTTLEDIGQATIDNSSASTVYDRVIILQDGDFKKSTIRATLA